YPQQGYPQQGVPMQPGYYPQQGYIPPGQPLVPGYVPAQPQPVLMVNDPLEKLGACSSALIEQQFELLEVLTGCETKNRYNVSLLFNGAKVPLFACQEESSWCSRNCCPSDSRPFMMKMKQIVAQNVVTREDFTKPYITFQRDFKCTCCCLARPNMKGTFNESGVYFGKVQEPCSCCSPVFNVYNKDNLIRYSIFIDCCQCGFCCRTSFCGKLSEAVFNIFEGNSTQGVPVGKITRKVRGFENLISDADTFVLEFPPSASPEEKLMLIGSVLMIDYRYYESTESNDENNVHRRPHPY
ncbi:MAG: hypothetical protein MJ252_22430, partial [archaeon]|nr:hypothetical protein [archaeon]